MNILKVGLASAVMIGSLYAAVPEASAMPVAPVATQHDAGLEQVRLVCGPYRCFRTYPARRWDYRRWGYRRYGYWHPRPARIIRRVLRPIF